MSYNRIVMDAAKSYSDQGAHVRAGEIIKAHSENKEDIREIARGMIDRNGARSMLDLGCGYGLVGLLHLERVRRLVALRLGISLDERCPRVEQADLGGGIGERDESVYERSRRLMLAVGQLW